MCRQSGSGTLVRAEPPGMTRAAWSVPACAGGRQGLAGSGPAATAPNALHPLRPEDPSPRTVGVRVEGERRGGREPLSWDSSFPGRSTSGPQSASKPPPAFKSPHRPNPPPPRSPRQGPVLPYTNFSQLPLLAQRAPARPGWRAEPGLSQLPLLPWLRGRT